MLSFLIPVRHPATVPDWSVVKGLMAQTFQSIAAQDHPDWQCVIAADASADLPKPPGAVADKFHVVRTALPPARIPPKNRRNPEPFFNAIRADKGARLKAAFLGARPSGYVMVTDFDDLVSRRLAGFVAAQPDRSGWYFESGKIWPGGRWILDYPERFFRFCGTSHILSVKHLEPILLDDPGSDELTISFLGSHTMARDMLAKTPDALEPLPFDGAVYRVAHSGATSQQSIARVILKGRTPWGIVRRLRNLHAISPSFRTEFLGA